MEHAGQAKKGNGGGKVSGRRALFFMGEKNCGVLGRSERERERDRHRER